MLNFSQPPSSHSHQFLTPTRFSHIPISHTGAFLTLTHFLPPDKSSPRQILSHINPRPYKVTPHIKSHPINVTPHHFSYVTRRSPHSSTDSLPPPETLARVCATHAAPALCACISGSIAGGDCSGWASGGGSASEGAPALVQLACECLAAAFASCAPYGAAVLLPVVAEALGRAISSSATGESPQCVLLRPVGALALGFGGVGVGGG